MLKCWKINSSYYLVNGLPPRSNLSSDLQNRMLSGISARSGTIHSQVVVQISKIHHYTFIWLNVYFQDVSKANFSSSFLYFYIKTIEKWLLKQTKSKLKIQKSQTIFADVKVHQTNQARDFIWYCLQLIVTESQLLELWQMIKLLKKKSGIINKLIY